MPEDTPILVTELEALDNMVRELERIDARLLGRGEVGYPVRQALEFIEWAAQSAREATDA